jgi:hypothetical protein
VISTGIRYAVILLLLAHILIGDHEFLRHCAAEPMERVLFTVEGMPQEVSGRILTEAQDGGILLEDRAGRIFNLLPDVITERQLSEAEFSYLSSTEFADALQTEFGGGFSSHTTAHYVICFQGAPHYAEFVGRLLEHVHGEYYDFAESFADLNLSEGNGSLPVIIFETREAFLEAAEKLHPEQDFASTPGFYSTRSNRFYLTNPCTDPQTDTPQKIRKSLQQSLHHIATVVHEATHQLAHHSGLQVRFADNPLWFSEGLALWFEPPAENSKLLWNRPGQVNPLHRTQYLKLFPVSKRGVRDRQPASDQSNDDPEAPAASLDQDAESDRSAESLTFAELVRSDRPFQSAQQAGAAYSKSWSLVSYLIRHEREAFGNYLKRSSQRQPLVILTAEERELEFREIFGKSPDEFEPLVGQYVVRLRVPR